MPHRSIALADGVNENRTPTLNEFGISTSTAIRYQFDNQNVPLVQKLGGWSKFYPQTITNAPIRALWAWEDINAVAHLAYGTETGGGGSAQLGVITSGVAIDITPTSTTDNVTPAGSTTSGSPVVTITDATTTGITSFDAVYIETHISVGGVVLFGLYPTTEVSATTYDVTALDILGNPVNATATTTTTTVASFATTSGSNIVTVTLANHGYAPGDTYPVLVSTTVGGITFYGNYIVETVPSSSTFTIFAGTNASSSTSGSINGGNARFVYSFGFGAVPGGTGYGIGGYGRGGYGTGTGITPATGTPITATNWTLDNWGEILIACPVNGTLLQPLYQWDPLGGSPIASIITQAPPLNDGFFVAMPQRQIIAWGSTETGIQDPLLIRWCDVNNFEVWAAQVTNQAGSYRIPKGSKIVGCIQGPQQGLIWTDIDLWSMQYIGPPDIYSFNEVGTGCGLISRKAAASANGIVYWMGPSQFFSLSGEGVQPMECPVWDVMFQDLDTTSVDKIRVAVNSRFNEVAWYFPTISSGGEVAAYVKYNYAIGWWDYGSIGRSAWIDQSVLGPPIGSDPTLKLIYQHETSTDADGAALVSNFQTGYFELNDADLMTFVDQVWPDFKYGTFGGTPSAALQLTFYAANYPGDTPTTYGPFNFTHTTQFVTPRIRARLLAMNIGSSDIGSFWRLGRVRYRFAPDGKF